MGLGEKAKYILQGVVRMIKKQLHTVKEIQNKLENISLDGFGNNNELSVRCGYESHYIDDDNICEMITLFKYIYENHRYKVLDYWEYACSSGNGIEIKINDYNVFIKIVRYCNTFNKKYLI
ncbi:MAG: hypothetical protein N2645_06860 [Clostridia bacterium]|nr:hypothetical protein [Clostridia bacterium]